MAYRDQIKNVPHLQVPEECCFPEWLTEVKPKKTPYIPQLGDELVFIKQGYQFYLKAVAKNNEYHCDVNVKLWQQRNVEIKDIEYVKIMNLNYEIKPPHLFCLELGIMEPKSDCLNEKCFEIKFHNMPEVSDFLILKPIYEQSIKNDWKPGKRFLCNISDVWWHGTVESREALDPLFPNSLFMCYLVLWEDTDERWRLSPWDMESTEQNVKWPCAVCNKGVGYNSTQCRFCGLWVHKRCSGIKEKLRFVTDFKCKRCKGEINEPLGISPFTPEGAKESGYQLKNDECERIVQGLSRIMDLSIAEHFLDPVNTSICPSYAFIIEYPINLNTIKRRLENRFYRRIQAVLFDVLYIAKNAEKFYKAESVIVIQARLVTYLCSTLIMDDTMMDLTQLYSELQLKFHNSEHTNKEEVKLAVESSKKRGRKMKRGTKREIIDNEPEKQQIKEEMDILCHRIGDDIHKKQDFFPSTFTDLFRSSQNSQKPVQEHYQRKDQQHTLQGKNVVDMDGNIRIIETYCINEASELDPPLQNCQKFLGTRSNIYSQENENESMTNVRNKENNFEGFSIPKFKFFNSVTLGSDGTRKVKFTRKYKSKSECLHNDQVKDFVAEVSSIENVLISYKPLNECVMCYEKFNPVDLTVMYQPLRTIIRCKNCRLLIYTIMNMSNKKNKLSENTCSDYKCNTKYIKKKHKNIK